MSDEKLIEALDEVLPAGPPALVAGEAVLFPVGRGKGKGLVERVDGDHLVIRTAHGATIRRSAKLVERLVA